MRWLAWRICKQAEGSRRRRQERRLGEGILTSWPSSVTLSASLGFIRLGVNRPDQPGRFRNCKPVPPLSASEVKAFQSPMRPST
jgi:hypothetical protein